MGCSPSNQQAPNELGAMTDTTTSAPSRPVRSERARTSVTSSSPASRSSCISTSRRTAAPVR